MTRCQSCGAMIRWATTKGGKSMPIDIAPVPDGNIEFVGVGFVVAVRGKDYAWPANVDRFVSHFSTCPDAAKHRKT